MDKVIRKEHVRDPLLLYKRPHVLQEIPAVHHVDLLEAAEEESRQCVAVAVLQDHQPPPVLMARYHAGRILIPAHKHAVRRPVAVVIMTEEPVAFRLTRHECRLIPSAPDALLHFPVYDTLRLETRVLRHVIYEILRRRLHLHVAGKGPHRAHVVMDGPRVVFLQRLVVRGCHLGKHPRGIVGTQRCPVVVGARIDGFLAVASQRVEDAHPRHVGVEFRHQLLDGRALILCPCLERVRTIDRHCVRNHHTIDVYLGECLFIAVHQVGILCCRLAVALKRLEGPHALHAVIQDDNPPSSLPCVRIRQRLSHNLRPRLCPMPFQPSRPLRFRPQAHHQHQYNQYVSCHKLQNLVYMNALFVAPTNSATDNSNIAIDTIILVTCSFITFRSHE